MNMRIRRISSSSKPERKQLNIGAESKNQYKKINNYYRRQIVDDEIFDDNILIYVENKYNWMTDV